MVARPETVIAKVAIGAGRAAGAGCRAGDAKEQECGQRCIGVKMGKGRENREMMDGWLAGGRKQS